MATLKRITALTLGLLAALLAFAVLTFGASEAYGHPAKAPHGHAYGKNYYPETYFAYAEPAGAKYLGFERSHKDTLRGYTSYQRVKRDGRFYYKLNARFATFDGQRDRTVEKPVYAALHKYEDQGSERPAFRVYMTHKATGKHYWRRFEAWNSEPPNAVIVGFPDWPVYAGETLKWKLFSPDPTARFAYRVVPEGVVGVPYRKCGESVSYVTKGGGYTFKVTAYDAAGHIDRTPEQAGYFAY
jgi:hypothetical protein